MSMRTPIAEFDRRWDQGLKPDVGEFVAMHDPISPSQLTHLLLIDQSRRWAGGEKVSVEYYFERFPDLLKNTEGAIDLLFAEFLLREEFDPTTSIAAFASRYPQFVDELCRQFTFHRTVGVELMHDDSRATANRKVDQLGEIERIAVPGYEILGELGRGGLGVVYLAREVRLNRKVALKMLLAGQFASDNLCMRLLLEAEVMARLQHPNIVQIYEAGQHAGHPFLALEFIGGGTLAAWMERRPRSPRDAANILLEVALAIQFAHENGVIHRDLKPSNLLVQPLPHARTRASGTERCEFLDGQWQTSGLSYNELQIKIADFGLAKFVEEEAIPTRLPTTLPGDLMGTVAYMSPEQAQRGWEQGVATPLTAATDIYSLGAILYELLTGRPPFVGVQPLEVLNQVLADEPVRPSQLVRHIPKDLQTICLKCLEKSPVRRYASAAALAEDLQRFLSNQPIAARHTRILERGWRWCRRNPVKTTLTALVASLLLMVVSLSSVYSIMLSNQLFITTNGEITQRSLKIQAIEQLWESCIAQADALRTSRLVGQRFESLQAIEAAQELGDSIQFEPNQFDRMRNATIAALALSDMRTDCIWTKPWPKSVQLQSFDDALSVCAFLLEPTLAVVQRTSDGMELARVENVHPESKLVLSRDGTKLAIFKDQCCVYRLNSPSHELLFESTSSGPWTFSGDGNHVIGSDGDGLLRLVDLQNPQSIKTIGNFRGKHLIAMSPNSQWAAVWIDHAIQVVDLDTGNVILRVVSPGLPFYQPFEWHPNSKILAIRSDQHGIELWDVAGGERLRTIPAYGPSMFVFDVNGNRLLTNQVWSDHLQLWIVGSGELEFSQKGLHFQQLAAAPAGGFNLIQSLDTETVAHVKISCPNIYQTIPALRSDSPGHGAADVAYSPDGRFLAYSSRGALEIFDAHTMTSLASAISPGCFLRFDFDGSLLTSNSFGVDANGNSERGISRWKMCKSSDSNSASEVAYGPPEMIYSPQAGFADAPFDVGCRGQMIAVPMDDGVSIWSAERGKSIRTQATHEDVRRVSISPDEKRVASAGWNSGNVCIWDAETGQLQHTIIQPTVCTAQFSPDGKMLATNAGEITIWETQSWQELYKIKVSGKPNSGVSLCFSPDSKLLAASDSLGRTHLIDAGSGRELLLLVGPTEKQINSLCFNPAGTQLAVLREGGTAHAWNLDVIQAELDARNLCWNAGEEIAPHSQGNAVDRLNSTTTDQSELPKSKLPKVDIRFDERFKQLEATQYIVQAELAAAQPDFNLARVAIAKALALKPQNPKACNRLAWLMVTGPEQLRDPERAMELAQIAVQHGTEAERRFYANTLGVAQYRAGKYEGALAMLKQSLADQSPESQPFDLYFLALCSSKLGEHNAAHEFFGRAELLKDQFRSSLAFEQQVELDGFSKEAKTAISDDHIQRVNR